MAQLLDTGVFSVVDTDSSLGIGWKVNFYATGTSARLDTYPTLADATAGTNANANPVIISADGRLPPIWYGASAKVILTDENDVVKETIDPVQSFGADGLDFIQSGTGAVSRTVQARLRDTVHLFDFVPVAKHAGILAGTNTDDLSAYFQAALDTGHVVRLPDTGMGWIADPIFIPSGGGMVGSFGFTIKAKADFGLYAMIRNETLDPATNAARDKGLIITGVKIDGNKANNSLSTEFCHCLNLRAVDGAYLDVWTVNPKGDGVLFQYAYPLSEDGGTNFDIGCNNIRGFIRSEGAARQGVALTCIENFDLSIYAEDAHFIACDLEPDHADNFVRHGLIRLIAVGCGTAGANTSGALLLQGTDALGTSLCDFRNIVVDMVARDCLSGDFGAGVSYRDATDIIIRGSIDNQTGVGVQSFPDGIGVSRVTMDLDINSPSNRGASLQGTGDIVNGSVRVRDAGDIGVFIKEGAGGTLQVQIEDSGQQGLYLDATTNMTFPNAVVTGSSSHGVNLVNTSTGNRFPNLVSTGSSFGYGLSEASSSNNNRATGARMSSNSSGNVTLVGATSLVEFEPLIGKATYDAPSIAAGASTTTTVTVTGAVVGDDVRVTTDLQPNGLMISGYVSANDTVTVILFNPTVGAIDLASTTLRAVVTRRTVV